MSSVASIYITLTINFALSVYYYTHRREIRFCSAFLSVSVKCLKAYPQMLLISSAGMFLEVLFCFHLIYILFSPDHLFDCRSAFFSPICMQYSARWKRKHTSFCVIYYYQCVGLSAVSVFKKSVSLHLQSLTCAVSNPFLGSRRLFCCLWRVLLTQ